MSVDDGLVDGSECRHEGVFEAGLVQYLRFETGGSPGRMGGRAVAFGVVEDQGPARSAFVVLPEPRGEAIDELQPRRSLVALPGLSDRSSGDFQALERKSNFSTGGLKKLLW